MRQRFLSPLRKIGIAALLLSPALALAALATVDLAGTARSSPTTTGAFEVIGGASVNAPTGLVLTIQRATS